MSPTRVVIRLDYFLFFTIHRPVSIGCQLFVGAAFVLDTGLGLGFDEPSTKTITQLAAEIAAIPNFTATVTGLGSVPAAFLATTNQQALGSTAVSVVAYSWSALRSSIANPLGGSNTNKNALDYENISSVQLQNCIYFANGYDEIYKYDGNLLYRAGVPAPASVTTAGTAGANQYIYRAQFIQVDSAGNTIEGNVTDADQKAWNEPSVNAVTVSIPTISTSSGFNTGCGLINAVSSGTTITVSSHTLSAGDTIYLWDTSGSGKLCHTKGYFYPFRFNNG
jgi:hypothetical protein